MTRSVRALCALVFVLSLVACEGKVEMSSAPATAATLDASEAKVVEVEREFNDLKRYRDMSVGQFAEVRPGDHRSISSVGETLAKLSVMQEAIKDVPNTDKVGNLRAGIRELMIEDCKLLLRKARSEQDIWALGSFVRYAQDLDVDLETDFSVKTTDLRKEALVMMKKQIVELRPRLKEDDGGAIGGLITLYNEWQFTREELGLTAEEAKLLVDQR